MRLNHDFIVHTLDDVTMIIPVSGAKFHGIVNGNKTVADIFHCLQHDTTEKEIVDVLCEKYEGDRALMEKDVADVISRLREIGAIDE